MRKGTLTFLFVILVVAFVLRVYKIDNPIADHHSWRQADTAAVSRNFIKEEFSIFRPHIDNFAPVRRPGLPNDKRLFFAEFPLYNFLVALQYRVFGIQEPLGRLTSIFFSLGTIVLLYLLVKETISNKVALWAAAFFAVVPYSVYFGRVFMPEPAMLFFSTGMIYFVYRWTREKKTPFLLWASVFSAVAFLVKPYSVFLLPVVIYLFLRGFRKRILKTPGVYLYLFISFVPLLLWRWYITSYEAGIPSFEWLFNLGNVRFSPAFFRWILFERFDKLILTFGGYTLFLVGILYKRTRKEGMIYFFWLFSIFLFITVFAAGNVTHDYYQVIFLPVASVFLAKGVMFFWEQAKKPTQKLFAMAVIGFCIASIIVFGWYEVGKFYDIQGGVDVAGKAVDQLTPKDALVITGDSADVTLLYNTNRHGWAGGFASVYPNKEEIIETLRAKGASVYVTTKKEELLSPSNQFGQYMLANFEVIEMTDQYIIFDISEKRR